MTGGIAVVGGGAAGLTAAIFAKRENPDIEVDILERSDRVGKKILATGNGRCNLSNENLAPAFYHGGDISFAVRALERFGLGDTLGFFESVGVPCRFEAGRIYPMSNHAAGVLDALRFECEKRGVRVRCGVPVQSIKKSAEGFLVNGAGYGRVIVACGGKSAPAPGADGSGYRLMTGLGHALSPVFPALVQVKTAGGFANSLRGIKAHAEVSVFVSGKFVRKERGEVLFTACGLSGIPILSLSRDAQKPDTVLSVDFLPDFGADDAKALIQKRLETVGCRRLEDFLTGLFHKRVGQALFKAAGILPLSRAASSLSGAELKRLACAIKTLPLKAAGTNSWQDAQTTAGGIATRDFSPETMESQKAPGLFCAGEMLDIDGDCGGYNLQWAWTSGALAGRGAARC